MSAMRTFPNRDLQIVEGNKARWNCADERRWGFHNLHRVARYSMSLRAAEIMHLEKRIDLRIADLDAVQRLTSLPCFCAMVVVRGQNILFERYASDFGKDQPHSIQSITKTLMNLVIGRLVEQGLVDLSRRVAEYIPEIGSGYAAATVQEVLNMDVVNEYSEDFTDPDATYYRHEEAMGWRLPQDPAHEQTQRLFLAKIRSDDIKNRTGFAQYKDANTDVLGWVAERASSRPLRAFLADIVDAAGLEGAFYITTDREGVPALDGGASVTARDLARYMSIFARRGRGIHGDAVVSADFIERTLAAGIPMSPAYQGMRYSNHALVSGRSLSHAGWGGEYAIANLETGAVAVFFSVKEDAHAATPGYMIPIMQTLQKITGAEFLAL